MLDAKGSQILAKSLFKELRGSGYTPNQILSLSTELIDLVTQDLKAGHAAPHAAVVSQDAGSWRAAL
jgi:pyruvate-formate lyase-activating enzyme